MNIGVLFRDGVFIYKEKISDIKNLKKDNDSIQINTLGLGILPLSFHIYGEHNHKKLFFENDFQVMMIS